MSLRMAAWGAIALAAVTVCAGLASGQQQQRPATLDDLLREMQALRADLKETSAASMRVQALVARVGLQEQRLKALSLQLNEANTQLEQLTRDRTGQQQQLAQMDDALSSGTLPPQVPREEIEVAMGHLKVAIAQLQERETATRDRANQLSGLVSTEQGRWEELNGRLDALDQLLDKPQGR